MFSSPTTDLWVQVRAMVNIAHSSHLWHLSCTTCHPSPRKSCPRPHPRNFASCPVAPTAPRWVVRGPDESTSPLRVCRPSFGVCWKWMTHGQGKRCTSRHVVRRGAVASHNSCRLHTDNGYTRSECMTSCTLLCQLLNLTYGWMANKFIGVNSKQCRCAFTF